MSVVKLTTAHVDLVRELFTSSRYMGANIEDFGMGTAEQANARLYDIFCSNYLSGINDNYHAFGWISKGRCTAIISFYESDDEPAWYYTMHRSSNPRALRTVLDAVLDYNEQRGRLKFYTLVHERHSASLRRFHWSEHARHRYDYFDEFTVGARERCWYSNAWELLYKRCLLPVPTVVRCNFLKQSARAQLPKGGSI